MITSPNPCFWEYVTADVLHFWLKQLIIKIVALLCDSSIHRLIAATQYWQKNKIIQAEGGIIYSVITYIHTFDCTWFNCMKFYYKQFYISDYMRVQHSHTTRQDTQHVRYPLSLYVSLLLNTIIINLLFHTFIVRPVIAE